MSATVAGSTQRCTYCDLPVGGDATDEAVYCCYGCRFAHSVVQERGDEGAIRWTVVRLGLAIFFTMNLMAFTMTMWSLDVYDVEPDPFQQTLFEVFRWLSMLLALPVLILLGAPMLQNAVQSLQRRMFSTDLLIIAAVAAAYVTSVVNVIRSTGTTYFEVGAAVLVMITLGRWIEAAGRQKATEALDQLIALLPTTVRKIVTAADKSVDEFEVESDSIRPGDTLRIRSGERIPVDAELVTGRTTVDEQIFTGESLPVEKMPGDQLLAGTTNLEGDVHIHATSRFKQGSFGRLLETLQNARNAQGHYQRLTERVAAWFFPVVAVIAAVVFMWHLDAGVADSIQVTMSVLLIACPCALGLATPLAVWTSLSTAVRRQVIFRSGEAIERLADAKAVCLDKTGTLTTGTPRVFQVASFGDSPQEFIDFAGLLAEASTHPFSRAVTEYAKTESPQAAREPGSGRADALAPAAHQERRPAALQSIRTVPGGGVEAFDSNGRLLRLGSIEFSCCRMNQMVDDERPGVLSNAPDLCVNCRASVSLQTRVQMDRLRMSADQLAASIVMFSVDRIPVCGFLIAETIRPEAETALRQIAACCENVQVLSGDRASKGRFLQQHMKLKQEAVTCDLSPQQKVVRVGEVRREVGTTVMVGDGINDAPALAASDVGIAMGCGADVTRDSAQVCLLGNDLTQIPWAIRHARRTRKTIQQNLFWAFSYNSIGIVVAASGMLNPAIAAGLMIASSLLVISNSLRLLSDEESPAARTAAAPSARSNENNAGMAASKPLRTVEVA